MEFYSSLQPKKAHVFVLMTIHAKGSSSWEKSCPYSDFTLAKLALRFNRKFLYCLFLWTPMAKDLQGQVKVCVIKRDTEWRGVDTSPEEKEIPREDEMRMREFILGFLAHADKLKASSQITF